MRLPIALFAAAAGIAAASGASAASVEIRDAVARVTVVPESRNDIKVEFLSTNPSLPLTIRTMGDRTIVDGDLDRQIRECHGLGQPSVTVRGVGRVDFDDMPQVVIRTPRDVDVEAGGAVFGSVGRSASLDLSNAGCGDWTIANVDGRMKVSQAGSGDTHAGASGEAVIRIAGSGDIAIAEVRGGLDVEIAGSGDVSVSSINGAAEIGIAGSGDVHIMGGRAPTMVVKVAGSGDVGIDGVVGDLTAHVAGSGDIRVRQVTGQINKSIMGSGGVSVGN